jgi:hypothetical protein
MFKLMSLNYKFKKNYQIHLDEIVILKVKVQTLKTKNKILKFTCVSTSNTDLDM